MLTVEPAKSEYEESFSMPVLLDIIDSESEEDIVAVGPGTMRRRSPGEGREWMNRGQSGDSADERAGARRSVANSSATTAARIRRR